MGAGGTWTVQNKQRPGAYINFVSVPPLTGVTGTRGIVAIALPMIWGAPGELIELYGSDLLDGKSLAKVGCVAAESELSLPFRLALSNCYKALIYRSDVGGIKASVIVSAVLTLSAKYAGTKGNELTVVIVADVPTAGLCTVKVLVNTVIKEEFVVSTMAQIGEISSDWVDFTVAAGQGAAAIVANAGAVLVGGTNGTTVSDSYAGFFNLLTTAQWQAVAIQSVAAEVPALVYAKIKELRDTLGKRVQGIVYNDVSSDYEGIISVKQGFTTANDVVTVGLFPLWVASLTAGSAVNQSNTAAVIKDAVSIQGYIADSLVQDNLKAGWFILGYRQDGVVIVEQDINCLHTFTVNKSDIFRKNRIVRCLDEVGNKITLIFNTNYAGKIDNSDIGRNVFKCEILALIDSLAKIGAVVNFVGSADVTVLPGEEIDALVVDLEIQPADSMEKLYLTVNVEG